MENVLLIWSGENNNMGCEKIINKKSGAAMHSSTQWHDNTGPRGQKTDRPTGNPPGAPN